MAKRGCDLYRAGKKKNRRRDVQVSAEQDESNISTSWMNFVSRRLLPGETGAHDFHRLLVNDKTQSGAF